MVIINFHIYEYSNYIIYDVTVLLVGSSSYNIYAYCTYTYIILYSGKLWRGCNLANWQFYGKSPNLKSVIFYFDEI